MTMSTVDGRKPYDDVPPLAVDITGDTVVATCPWCPATITLPVADLSANQAIVDAHRRVAIHLMGEHQVLLGVAATAAEQFASTLALLRESPSAGPADELTAPAGQATAAQQLGEAITAALAKVAIAEQLMFDLDGTGLTDPAGALLDMGEHFDQAALHLRDTLRCLAKATGATP